jgi:hypothetical protein
LPRRLSTAAALDSLRGNGADSVLVWDVNGADDHLTIPTGFTFVLLTAPPSGQPWAELQSVEARPGATIDSRTPVFIGSIVAEGTPGDPVRIRGNIALGCGVRMTDCDGSSRFTHSEMQDVQLNAGTLIRLDSVVIRRGSLFLSDTARLARVVLEDAGYDAIAISGTSHFTTITDCRIARSGGAGITVFENATNVTVRDCAIEQNAGPGIQNHAADSVDARFNWWGDTGGPLGPAGDGVEGNVDYGEHLIAPPGEAVALAAGSGRRCGAGSCRSSSSILSAASDTPRTGPYLGVCRRIRYPSSCRYQPLTPGSGFLKSTRHTPPSRTGSSAMR